ncbi:MAG: hypothetical protein ACLR23_27690 [Clostridia bacterium]
MRTRNAPALSGMGPGGGGNRPNAGPLDIAVNFLSDRQLPHEICWEDGQEVCRVRIRADEDLPSALPQLLSIPLPERRNDLIAGVEAQGIAVDAQSIRRMEDGSLLEESRQ